MTDPAYGRSPQKPHRRRATVWRWILRLSAAIPVGAAIIPATQAGTPAGRTYPPQIHAAWTPIGTFAPVASLSGTRTMFDWNGVSAAHGVSVTAVPDGVDVTVEYSAVAETIAIPGIAAQPGVRVDTTAQVISSGRANLGLGCRAQQSASGYRFLLRDSGGYELQAPGPLVVTLGATEAIGQLNAPNSVSIFCSGTGATMSISAGAHGLIMAEPPVKGMLAAGWVPSLEICPCTGPVTVRFIHVIVSPTG